jgi:ElaA protein
MDAVTSANGPDLRVAAWHQLDPGTAYALLRLRVDVFVVEQRCPYPELDGRDTEPGTRHLWLADAAGPTAYLRLLVEPGGGHRIGRVCTRGDVRGRRLAAGLVAHAVQLADAGPVDLDAQSHLQRWYERLEFAVSGPEFVEDGIPHVPMRRPAHTVRA